MGLFGVEGFPTYLLALFLQFCFEKVCSSVLCGE